MGTKAQYLLVVNNARGFGRFQLFVNADDPLDTNDQRWSSIAGGSEISLQLEEPNGLSTFTVNVSEP